MADVAVGCGSTRDGTVHVDHPAAVRAAPCASTLCPSVRPRAEPSIMPPLCTSLSPKGRAIKSTTYFLCENGDFRTSRAERHGKSEGKLSGASTTQDCCRRFLSLQKQQVACFRKQDQNRGMNIGSCCVSTAAPNPDWQLAALKQTRGKRLGTEQASGVHVQQPPWSRCLASLYASAHPVAHISAIRASAACRSPWQEAVLQVLGPGCT